MDTPVVTRCVQCGGTTLEVGTARVERTIGARSFRADVPATRCSTCGEEYLPGPALEAFENAITCALVDAGASDGAAIRWLRKAGGLSAVALAELLDVRPETLSRWENDATPAPRAAVYALGTLALAALHGQTSPLARLQALAQPDPAPTESVALSLHGP